MIVRDIAFEAEAVRRRLLLTRASPIIGQSPATEITTGYHDRSGDFSNGVRQIFVEELLPRKWRECHLFCSGGISRRCATAVNFRPKRRVFGKFPVLFPVNTQGPLDFFSPRRLLGHFWSARYRQPDVALVPRNFPVRFGRFPVSHNYFPVTILREFVCNAIRLKRPFLACWTQMDPVAGRLRLGS